MKVIIRELRIEDASTSWKWRNDPEVWRLTGRKWTGEVTKEVEEKWIKETLKSTNVKRCAICVGEGEDYIGNVQFTDITSDSAVFHIFIGAKEYWGKGFGTLATRKALHFGFNELGLNKIRLQVRCDNIAARRIYENMGFTIVKEVDSMVEMIKVKNA